VKAVARKSLSEMRVSYGDHSLTSGQFRNGWFEMFQNWLTEAISGGVVEVNAMVLSVCADAPTTRTVLCKGIDESGLVFYTNGKSAKIDAIRKSPQVSVTFPWYAVQRQVHFRGVAKEVEPAESDAYWRARPRGSQLAAWASQQSDRARSRAVIDNAMMAVARRFENCEDIPRPAQWGGWRIEPALVEFWQGRENRLHDRLVLSRSESGWVVERLWP